MTDHSHYSLFPVQNHKLWDFYKRQSQAFWVPEEIDLGADLQDFEKMNDGERHFIKHVLAFFNQSDGIVNENLAIRFYQDVKIPEVRAFYAMQIAIEAIHAETYSLLLDTYIKDPEEKSKLFNAIDNVPAIKLKADWSFRWIDDQSASFAERLFAFAIIEGVFFSGSFCAIFWLRQRGLMPGLCKANDFISRDEGLHWTFAAELFKHLNLKLAPLRIKQIVNEAVKIEQSYVTDALPVKLIGMNSDLMGQYIQYTADRVLQTFGMQAIYHVDNPFSFMNLIDMQSKGNFFEVRVSEYKKGHDKQLTFDSDF